MRKVSRVLGSSLPFLWFVRQDETGWWTKSHLTHSLRSSRSARAVRRDGSVVTARREASDRNEMGGEQETNRERKLSPDPPASSFPRCSRFFVILSHHVPSTFTLFRRGRLPGIQLELVSSILRYPTSLLSPHLLPFTSFPIPSHLTSLPTPFLCPSVLEPRGEGER